MSITESIKPIWRGIVYHDHQINGINWMLDKEKYGTRYKYSTIYGGILADEMGLGKTIQMAATIKNNLVKKTLIVAPLAMISTWEEVMIKSGFNVFIADKGDWSPSTLGVHVTKRAQIFIVNYQKVARGADYITDTRWDRVVLDEAHTIRNPSGQTFKKIKKLHGENRWAITGTPVVNKMSDVVTLLAFLGVEHDKKCSWTKSYSEFISSAMIHRSVEKLRDVLADAPPRPIIEEKILSFATDQEKQFYRAIQSKIKDKYKELYAADALTGAKILKIIMRLRQISVHPQVYINAKKREAAREGYLYRRDDWLLPSTKLEALVEIINEERFGAITHKYIVFCQFHDEMNLMKEHLELTGVGRNVQMYHGGLTGEERTAVLNAARSEDCNVLLLQLHSGGVGLNLQEFDRAIFMSPWWNDAMIQQAIARVVRMGQKRVVRVCHLILAEEKTMNIDRRMLDKSAEKKDLLEKVFEMVPLI